MNQGLTGNQWVKFEELLAKANVQQLKKMQEILEVRLKRREQFLKR